MPRGYDVAMGTPRRGVSKGEWLEAGLELISHGSISQVTVEGLARSLGIAKAGFYWHFKNRDDLLRQMLNYWVHEVTEVITENPQILELDPRGRLVATAEMVVGYDLTRYEIAIRQWALRDSTAARAVRKVNRLRLEFIRSAFHELGFEGDDAEMRAMLFVCYQTWEAAMFRDISRKRRRQMIAKRVKLLTSR